MSTPTRVLIRVVASPKADRGECLAVLIDERQADGAVLVYSLTRAEYRVEPHRQLQWRTHRASLLQTDDVREQLAHLGLGEIVILQGAYGKRVRADEAPAMGGSRLS